MALAPFEVRSYLTGISIIYKNQDYIADLVAPRRPVSAAEFQWDKWNIETMYTVPDTSVGRMSAPNQVTFEAARQTDSTLDYALDVPVPNEDIQNAQTSNGAIDPLGIATEAATELIALGREIRVAEKAFTAANYPSSQRTTLSGTSQWSDPASTPIEDILGAKDAMLMPGGYLVISQPVWTALRTNPEVVEGVLGTAATRGVVSREAVASLLELQGILVGVGWANTAKPGQTPVFSRVWGKHASLMQINPLSQLRGAVVPTFMLTAEFGTRQAGTISDPDMGADGGVRVRAKEKVKEVIVSDLAGYFFQNAVA